MIPNRGFATQVWDKKKVRVFVDALRGVRHALGREADPRALLCCPLGPHSH